MFLLRKYVVRYALMLYVFDERAMASKNDDIAFPEKIPFSLAHFPRHTKNNPTENIYDRMSCLR